MHEFSIKYTNEGPNMIYEINGRVTIHDLQILEQQIKGNEKNVCKHGRGVYSFDVLLVSGDDTMILNPEAEYANGHRYILTLRKYDPND